MKVFIFSESYVPVRNGVAISVVTLRDELRSLGHQVYVAAPSFSGYDDDDPDIYRFSSVRTLGNWDYPLAIPYMPGFMNKVRELKPDIIHTQTPFMLGLLGQRIARRLDIPLISTNHTQYAEYAHYIPFLPVTFTSSVIIRHLRLYYNRCDEVIVPTSPVAEMLKGYGVRTPTVAIPTGNSLNCSRDNEIRAVIRQKHGIPDDALVLIYAGRLAREKNIGLLINAFERIAAKRKNTYLVLIGGGPYETELKVIAEQTGFSDRIVFTGSIPRDLVGKYYSAGDIFSFPSTTETQGLVICEALEAGLPAVVVRAGGSPEMVVDGEDSLLAENDIDDFTEKIERLLSDRELLSRLSERAVRNACRFTPQEMARRILKAYESAIELHNR